MFGINTSTQVTELKQEVKDLSNRLDKKISEVKEWNRQLALFTVHSVLSYTGVIIAFTVIGAVCPVVVALEYASQGTVFYSILSKCKMISAIVLFIYSCVSITYFLKYHNIKIKTDTPLLNNLSMNI